MIDEEIESRMDLVRNLISLGRNIREEVKIKVRQPISECLIDGKNESLISDLTPLIEEELNVKKVTFITNLSEYMNFTVKPNFKEVGKIFGPKMKRFGELLLELSNEEVSKLQNNESISMEIEGEKYDITSSMVEIRANSKEGFDVATDASNFVILKTELTEDLILEGIARELVSKVQNLRKTSNFEIADRIYLYYKGDEKVKEAVNSFKEFIQNETLSLDIIEDNNAKEEVDLNGHITYLRVEKKED